jgi:hypothetical protein
MVISFISRRDEETISLHRPTESSIAVFSQPIAETLHTSFGGDDPLRPKQKRRDPLFIVRKRLFILDRQTLSQG